MNFSGWLIIGVSLASLYLLGLVIYRVFLNVKALKVEIDKAQQLISESQRFDELPIAPATPSSQAQLDDLLVKRRSFLSNREKKAQDEQRRLVQRIRDIEIDKR
jgi:hypothetical protein